MQLLRRLRAAFAVPTRSTERGDEHPDLRLRVESELEVLEERFDFEDFARGPLNAPGIYTRIHHASHVDELDLAARLVGKIAGDAQPVWADGSGGALAFGVCICRVKSARYMPSYGAVITADGAVLRSSIGEALYVTPDLSALPSVTMDADAPILKSPRDVRRFPKAAIFMAWGGRFNYGHFVLDCLSALCVMAEKSALRSYPILAPELTAWQRELLGLMLGEDAANIQEIPDELVAVDDLIFATPMDHFLHAPNGTLKLVRDRILGGLPPNTPGPERIYLTRRDAEKRPMLNEAELEREMELRGFAIVEPEALSIEEQLQLFRSAKVIVGATGAALTNCLFCSQGAKVFEIQPSNYTGVWTRALCHQIQIEWHGYFAPSPARGLPESSLPPGAMFAWRTPIDDFLAFLSGHLN